MDIIACDIQPVQNLKVLNRYAEREETKEAKDAAKASWAKHFITEGFVGLEAELSRVAGTYCVGDSLTLADAYLVPQVFNANRFGVDMSKFPTIQRVNDTLKALPAFIAADAANQPDAVAV